MRLLVYQKKFLEVIVIFQQASSKRFALESTVIYMSYVNVFLIVI